MNLEELKQQWEENGKRWVEGKFNIKGWNIGYEDVVLTEKQLTFLNSKKPYCLFSGGYAAGKTLALMMKAGLLCLFFPNNLLLMGRKTLTELEINTMKNFQEVWPRNWYIWNRYNRTVKWFNGSEIILFGLDSLQEGTQQDIRKAQQAIKSLNLGGFIIDQLEEIEYEVFLALTGRMRRNVLLQQAIMTSNPANYWAYDYFKENPQPDTELTDEANMLEILELLKKREMRNEIYRKQYQSFRAFVERQLKSPKEYVERYVYGKWTPESWKAGQVFYKEYIDSQRALAGEPLREWEGAKVFEEVNPDHDYQVGVDPSEGAVDPCGIVVSDQHTGRVVLSYSDYVPAHIIAGKAVLFGRYYNEGLLVPEKTGNGLATLEKIIDLDYPNIISTQVFDQREETEKDRLGWITNARTKRLLISNFMELLRRGWPKLNDERIIKQMYHFIWTDEIKKKGAGAEANYHDDLLMATMLSFYGHSPMEGGESSYSIINSRRNVNEIIKPVRAIYR